MFSFTPLRHGGGRVLRRARGAASTGAQLLALDCSAPASQFAFLDQEGKTYIHSTVVGSCTAEVTRVPAGGGAPVTTTYESKGRSLLEVKE